MSSSTSHVQARGQLASHPCCIAHSPANAERRLTFCNTLVNAEWDVVLYAGWLSVTVSQMSPIRDLPLPLVVPLPPDSTRSQAPEEVTMGNAVSLWSTSRAPAADSTDSGERRAAAFMAAGMHVVAARLRLTMGTRATLLPARCIFPYSRYI